VSATVRVKVPTGVREVMASFAAAELDSSEYGKAYKQLLSTETRTLLRSRALRYWSTQEQDAAISVLMAYRGGYIQPFLVLNPLWYRAEVEVERVAELRSTEQLGFRELAPNLDLGTMVTSLEAGRVPSDGSFARRYRELRTNFLPPAVRGRPIIVAKSASGPFTVMEGTTRLCAMLALHRRGEKVASPVSLYLGVTPLRDQWRF
jgi:hypothetical protein